MRRACKNLKGIILYSDTELLEFCTVMIFVFVNPLRQQAHSLNTLWYLAGILSGLLILYGLMKRSLYLREWGLLVGLANLTAVNAMELRHLHLEPGYLLQNFVVGFTWWRVGKQRLIAEVRKGCENGKY